MLSLSRDNLLAAAMPANVIISIIINDSPSPFALGHLPLSSFTNPHPLPDISLPDKKYVPKYLFLKPYCQVGGFKQLEHNGSPFVFTLPLPSITYK